MRHFLLLRIVVANRRNVPPLDPATVLGEHMEAATRCSFHIPTSWADDAREAGNTAYWRACLAALEARYGEHAVVPPHDPFGRAT